jgi:hypothetical protein
VPLRPGTVGLWSEWLACRVGRRGCALLFFAFLDFVYSVSLFAPSAASAANVRFLEDLAPFPLWGSLWAAVGVVCLVNAFRIKDRVGFAAAIAIKVLWSGVYTLAAVNDTADRAYVSATIWLCLAGWVGVISAWPEPPCGHLLVSGDKP